MTGWAWGAEVHAQKCARASRATNTRSVLEALNGGETVRRYACNVHPCVHSMLREGFRHVLQQACSQQPGVFTNICENTWGTHFQVFSKRCVKKLGPPMA